MQQQDSLTQTLFVVNCNEKVVDRAPDADPKQAAPSIIFSVFIASSPSPTPLCKMLTPNPDKTPPGTATGTVLAPPEPQDPPPPDSTKRHCPLDDSSVHLPPKATRT